MATSQKFIPPTYGPDVLARQLQMQQDAERAKIQMQQGMQSPQGQMVSGHYVAPSITQYLAQGLNAYLGREGMNKLPEQHAELQQMQQQQMMGQFGFGQPSPQALAAGLGGEQPQAGMGGDMGGIPQQGHGPMLLPGMDDQQSLAVLNSVGGQEYAKLLAKAMTQRGTSAMQNAAALGLQPGTPEYNAYIERVTGTPQTVVNVGGDAAPGLGKLSSDYGYVLDPETRQPVIDPSTGLPQAAPVPGSPAAQSIASAEEKAAGAQRQKARAGTTVVQDLQRAIDLIPELGTMASGEGVAGGIARTSSAKIPGTVANRITQFTESALSNVGLDTLQTMRENSPTGGALGQVPIQQQQRLEQVLGSLNINQPPAVLEANIKRVMNIYTDIIYGDPAERAQAVERGTMTPDQSAEIDSYYYELPFDERGRPIDQAGDAEPIVVRPQGRENAPMGGEIPTISSPDQLQGLPSGTVFRAPDGSLRRVP